MSAWVPAIAGLVGVVVGAIIGMTGEYVLYIRRRGDELRDRQAELDHRAQVDKKELVAESRLLEAELRHFGELFHSSSHDKLHKHPQRTSVLAARDVPALVRALTWGEWSEVRSALNSMAWYLAVSQTIGSVSWDDTFLTNGAAHIEKIERAEIVILPYASGMSALDALAGD